MKITTAGESHGKGLFAIIEGFPAGLSLDMVPINNALARRQSGFGRGSRQGIECDRAEILSGVFGGVTSGSLITVAVWNRDCGEGKCAPLTAVRPGHADLTGTLKYGGSDARAVSERASARETAVRVAAGEICRLLLGKFGVSLSGYTCAIGPVSDGAVYPFERLSSRDGETGMLDPALSLLAKGEIEAARASGDTLGGICEIRVKGLKSGFGSCMTYAQKLDARLASAILGIQAAKGVEFGAGFFGASLRGSAFHDEIFCEEGRIFRKTNRAGGIEGGMSNGEEIVLRAAMKPLPTLQRGLASVDLAMMKPSVAAAERGDVCAIVAFEQISESVVAAEICAAVLERLGGDTVEALAARYGELPL